MRTPEFVTFEKCNKNTRLHFPVVAHPIEKRLMVFFLVISIVGFSIYGYLKPDTAILTEGLILYQVSAFLIGFLGLVKFLSLVIGRVYIQMGKVSIDLYYGRHAKRKLQRISTQRIDQIYVEQIETLFGYKYYVTAITKNKKEHIIYRTYHSQLAKYIEYTLENYLGITNRPVLGEFQGIRHSSDDQYL